MTRATDAYLACRPHHEWFVMRANRNEDYYFGKHWTQAEVDAAGVARGDYVPPKRKQYRNNFIRPIVNTLLGAYAREQVSFEFKGRDGSDEDFMRGQLLTSVVEQVLDIGGYHNAEHEMFRDGIITSRGFIDIRIRTDDNVIGDIVYTALDPREVVIPEGARDYDVEKWPEVLITRWVTLDEVELLYGKAARWKAEAAATSTNANDALVRTFATDGDAIAGHAYPASGALPRDDSMLYVLLIERQSRKMRRQMEFVDLATGDRAPVPDNWDEEQVRAVADAHGYALRRKMRQAIWWEVEVAGIKLHESWSPYPHFTVQAFFPDFTRGRAAGVVDSLVDPQTMINDADTAVVEAIRATANSGWVVEEGSLVGMTPDELEERGGDDNLVIVHRRNRPAPEKIRPNPIPTGFESFARKARSYLMQISGVEALLGDLPNAEVSGVTLSRAQANASLQLQALYLNLQRTREQIARKTLTLVQQFYTTRRTFRIAGEELTINAGDTLTNVTLGRYDVVVGTKPRRGTADEREFATALELVRAGVPIPPEYIVEVSPLKKRKEIADEIRRLGGRAAPDEAQIKMAEMARQLELAKAQAEVAKLQAQATELQARAELNAGKAMAEASKPQVEMAKSQTNAQLELARIQAQLEQMRENLQNKLVLADMHIGAKMALNERKIEATSLTRMLDMLEADIADAGGNAASGNAANTKGGNE